MVGVLLGANGRPQHVYANRLRPSLKDLRHEIAITDVLLNYEKDFDMIRHPGRVNRRLRPDAELVSSDPSRLLYLELDAGTESLTVVEDQQKAYTRLANLLPEQDSRGEPCYRGITRPTDVFLLYVTLSPRRLENLKQRSGAAANIALFTTLDRVMAEPRGRIWETCDGRQVRIVGA